MVDQFGERIELLEEFVADESDAKEMRTPLKELFLVKRDLLHLRKTIAPERDVMQVLIRGDIRELREPGRRAYFQDVYDHIIRVTDEIDTFRELTSNVIDAYLAAASNRLNQVMKVLTSVATVLLVWGFRAVVHRAREEGRSVPALVIASVLFSPFLVLLALRRRR